MDKNQLSILEDGIALAKRFKGPYDFPKELQEEIDSVRIEIENSTISPFLSGLDVKIGKLITKITGEATKLLQQYNADTIDDGSGLGSL